MTREISVTLNFKKTQLHCIFYDVIPEGDLSGRKGRFTSEVFFVNYCFRDTFIDPNLKTVETKTASILRGMV